MTVYQKAMVMWQDLLSLKVLVLLSSESEEKGQMVLSLLVDNRGSNIRMVIELVQVGQSDGLGFRRGGVVLGSERGEGVIIGSKRGEGVVI